MARYRKRPVIIDAIQFTGKDINQTLRFIEAEWIAEFEDGKPVIRITTLEGVMTARVGDYIIKGVAEEFYPCRKDVFISTYESVDDEVTRSWERKYE